MFHATVLNNCFTIASRDMVLVAASNNRFTTASRGWFMPQLHAGWLFRQLHATRCMSQLLTIASRG
jgi:hypothetical protein